MQSLALITRLAQTPPFLGDAPSLSSHFPPGIALHGDEWELILGIKMLFLWGCGGSGNVVVLFEMHIPGKEARRRLREHPRLSPKSLRGPQSFWMAGVSGASGTAPGSHAKLQFPLQLFQAHTAAFPWPVNHGI